jgi:hypothetical protein
LKLILHIGSPKTGTTAIQDGLMAQAPRLAAAGYGYAEWLEPTVRQAALMVHNSPPPRNLRDKETRDKNWYKAKGRDALRRLSAASTGYHTVILSAEALFNVADQSDIDDLATEVKNFSGDVQVVCYLRHPVDYYLAYQAHHLRTTTIIKPFDCPDYAGVLRRYEQHFPLAVVKYDRDGLVGGDSYTDFVSRFLNDVLPKTSADKKNVTLSKEALAIMWEYRSTILPNYNDRHMGDAHQLYKQLLAADNTLGIDRKLVAQPAVAKAIAAGFQSQRLYLKRHGIDFALPKTDIAPTPILRTPSDIYLMDEGAIIQLRNHLLKVCLNEQIKQQEREKRLKATA